MTNYAQHEHKDFTSASLEALQEPKLQQALSKLGDTLAAGNRAAWGAMPGSDRVRDQAKKIKDQALARLDELLDQLDQSVKAAGGQVHWAKDAGSAREIVLQIARENQVQKIVKSKSMTSEEIHLNPALESAGIEVVETDFGEYIAQAAKHRPSHLVAPIIHMTIDQVQQILSNKLDQQLPADAKQLAQAARMALREQFRTADMGISGANFVIAETGSICIISNEGNARLTTTVPPIHVAIAGIEKVIPKFADLPVFLKLLARAATGQKMSVYSSIISGPRQEAELDGPTQFHLIMLDNGRSRILGSSYRESLQCIRCGACLNACPVYRKVGGHSYGGVYAGPIGAVLTPLYDGVTDYPLLPHASSLCGACQEACPVKIAIPHMLIKLRKDLAEVNRSGRLERWAYSFWKTAMKSPALYKISTWIASRILGRTVTHWYRKLPGPVGQWTRTRDFPAPANRTFHEQWRALEKRGN